MTASAHKLVARIRADLRAAADPGRAPAQQAYMKSAMPYLGVGVPETRRIARTAARELCADSVAAMAAALALWDEASHREERYAAMGILNGPSTTGEVTVIPIIEHMVRTGQWWDYTDDVASRVGELLDASPDRTAGIIRRWSVSDDMWLRRVAIISQLGRRQRVDPELLADVLEPNVADPEFFIRKAIGWALRDYARQQPDWVRAFADTHALSPLSRREALKHL